ncbi:hypothetical protein KTE13_02100 [Burkholderia multivorans]|uniref:hypothetical protein n=1 Tax=Burkholderia multivorans TaxID=87883 RepID=UPI001C211985|nr:hypothetical protein [Burkholderia multivorans]MBU9398518.1 hypothetical protein [Burkholderia multivorans]
MTIDFTGTAPPELASCLSTYLFHLSGMNRATAARMPGGARRPRAEALSRGPAARAARPRRARRTCAACDFPLKTKGLPRLGGDDAQWVISAWSAACVPLPATGRAI